MDTTSFVRLSGLCKAMGDHSKGIVGNLQAKLSEEKERRHETFKKWGRLRHIVKLLQHKKTRRARNINGKKVAAKMVKAKTEDECDKLLANFDRSQKGLKQYVRRDKTSFSKARGFGMSRMRI